MTKKICFFFLFFFFSVHTFLLYNRKNNSSKSLLRFRNEKLILCGFVVWNGCVCVCGCKIQCNKRVQFILFVILILRHDQKWISWQLYYRKFMEKPIRVKPFYIILDVWCVECGPPSGRKHQTFFQILNKKWKICYAVGILYIPSCRISSDNANMLDAAIECLTAT